MDPIYDVEYSPADVGSGEIPKDFDVYMDDKNEEGEELGTNPSTTPTDKPVAGKEGEKPAPESSNTVKAVWGDKEVEIDLSDREMIETALTQALIGQQLHEEKQTWEAKYADIEKSYAEVEQTLSALLEASANKPVDMIDEVLSESNIMAIKEDPNHPGKYVRENPELYMQYKKWLSTQVNAVNQSDELQARGYQQRAYDRLMREQQESERASAEARQAQTEAQKQEIQSKVQSWTNAQWESIKAKVDTAKLPAVQKIMRMLLSEASTRNSVDTDALAKELNELVAPYMKTDTGNRANAGTKALQTSVSGASGKVGNNSTNELSKQIAEAQKRGDISAVMNLMQKAGIRG
jgi:hypothetical protein